MVVAFIRIMGRPVGVVANNPGFGAGVLNVTASDKAARFIRFCDSFNIPILTFTDVPGYIPGTEQEWRDHPARGETAPCLLGGLGAQDQCRHAQGLRRRLHRHVLPGARRGLRDGLADGGDRRHRRRWGLQHHLPPRDRHRRDPAAKRKELCDAYEEKFNSPYLAAELGIIDEIILPRETRRRVVALLDALKDKAETRLPKNTATSLSRPVGWGGIFPRRLPPVRFPGGGAASFEWGKDHDDSGALLGQRRCPVDTEKFYFQSTREILQQIGIELTEALFRQISLQEGGAASISPASGVIRRRPSKRWWRSETAAIRNCCWGVSGSWTAWRRPWPNCTARWPWAS